MGCDAGCVDISEENAGGALTVERSAVRSRGRGGADSKRADEVLRSEET